MRIGEFAQKHNITQDTIRYYLDIGLLVTEKKGGQYKFSEVDSKDIEKIMGLKQLEFSLTEIQKILIFQRISGTNTEAFRNLYLPFLEAKKDEVTNELIKYNKMNDFLSKKITEIKSQETTEKQKLGFPMTSLGMIVCPLCDKSLSLDSGTIEENMIINANVQCICGYKAIIENGIYIDETAVRTKLENGKKMRTKEEYLATCSHTEVNFIYKGMTRLIEYINKYGREPKYIMEIHNCVGFFLLQYIKYIPKDTTYILIDYDKDRIIQLKRNLEMYYEHKNFIFLCCDYNKLPITKSSIDIIVDFLLAKTSIESRNEPLLDRLLPILKENGIFTASYNYFESNFKHKSKLLENDNYFDTKGSILNALNSAGLLEVEVNDIGPLYKDGEINSNIKNTERYQVAYLGKKVIYNG